MAKVSQYTQSTLDQELTVGAGVDTTKLIQKSIAAAL